MEIIKRSDLENFAEAELAKNGFRIIPVTEDYLHAHIVEVMDFVNGILKEYEAIYPMWSPKPEEWFSNPLDRKFRYSFLIRDEEDKIAFLNFTSVYGSGLLHNHCSYTGKDYRGMGLAKLHMIKIANLGLKDGFVNYEGYWDKHNNGSLILHLKMGFRIEDMRKKEQLYLVGDLKEVRDRTLRLYQKRK